MGYEKIGFVPGQTLTAANMNHIEDGIAEIASEEYRAGLVEAVIEELPSAEGVSY